MCLFAKREQKSVCSQNVKKNVNKIKNLAFRSRARAASQGSATISTSDPNIYPGSEVARVRLGVAEKLFTILDFSVPQQGHLEPQEGPLELPESLT